MWVRRLFALTLFVLPFGACGGKSIYTEGGGEAGSGSGCEDTLCGGDCVDLSSDTRHCGSCFDACAGNQQCSGGRCVEMRCDPPYVWCAGGCADLRTSNENCGTCGNVCGPGTTCSGGRCYQQCPSGQCGDVCVDFSSDPNNCGSCGFVCSPSQYCARGFCNDLCPGGALCANGCVDLGSDPQNCGACGNRCPADLACIGGICQGPCPPGWLYCNGACIDWRTDPANCGGCNSFCPDDSACIDAICQPRCLGGTWCGGVCVDLASDPNHCGQCFSSCPAGFQCAGGGCFSSKCGDRFVDYPAEEGDPPPGPAPVVPLDPRTCRYDFSRINQWYCHEACGNWGGPKGCDQLDADAFCKLKMDNRNSTAVDWRTTRAMEAPGVCCPPPTFEPGALGCTPLGMLSSRGVDIAVSVHQTNLFSTHQGGMVITDLVCTNP
jgi:hypothetical protein